MLGAGSSAAMTRNLRSIESPAAGPLPRCVLPPGTSGSRCTTELGSCAYGRAVSPAMMLVLAWHVIETCAVGGFIGSAPEILLIGGCRGGLVPPLHPLLCGKHAPVLGYGQVIGIETEPPAGRSTYEMLWLP